eukprot:scaffold7000_cov156-Skeletonema_dohrnii-CCMP3373.AAC.12
MDQAIDDGAADEENALLSVLRQEQQQSMQQMEERLRQLFIDNNHNENPKKKPISASSYGDATALTERSPNMAADDQYYTMVEDIYSIMCVSPGSQPFVYATTIFLVKILFYLLILSSIFIKATIFPTEVEDLVKATQFFMLPITVLVTDSGVLTAMFVYAHLKWSPEIEAQNQLATKKRYIYANIARSVDAVLYQVVIFFVLLQATEVLAVFLNFAALRFFMEIHTVAFEVARNGFLSVPLYKAAADVRRIQIKATRCDSTQRTARIFFVVSLTVMCVSWFLLSVVY